MEWKQYTSQQLSCVYNKDEFHQELLARLLEKVSIGLDSGLVLDNQAKTHTKPGRYFKTRLLVLRQRIIKITTIMMLLPSPISDSLPATGAEKQRAYLRIVLQYRAVNEFSASIFVGHFAMKITAMATHAPACFSPPPQCHTMEHRPKYCCLTHALVARAQEGLTKYLMYWQLLLKGWK